MTNIFEALSIKQDISKLRFFLIAAIITSPLFYFLMSTVNPSHKDILEFRIFISLLAGIGLALTYVKSINFKVHAFYFDIIVTLYLLTYALLLPLNDWSIFHRWSYFVVMTILLTVNFNLRSLNYIITIAFILPLLLSFSDSLPLIDLLHFHAAALSTIAVIGLSLRSNYKYRAEVISLTKNKIQATKMTSLGEMAAGIAHEINNPLSIIMLSSSKLQKSMISPTPEQNEHLQRIQGATKRISTIIKNLIFFSSDQSSSELPEPMLLKSLLTDTLDMVSEKFRAHQIDLSIETIPDNIKISVRKHELMQALLNLLNNAFDAVQKSPQKRVYIKTKVFIASNSVHITVSDTGAGVPEELEPKIMEPFFTTKDVGQGIGLGLSSALGLVQSNGGNLFLDRSQCPSSFVVQLPILKN